jgi:hypothetical protein
VKKLDTFNRKFLGCPLDLDFITKEDCHPDRGIIDLKIWKELNKRAAKIFIYGQKKDGKVPSRQLK